MNMMELKNIILQTNYFIDNEYLDKYCNIIYNNLHNKKITNKTERHHYIPLCYYSLLSLNNDRKYNEELSKNDNNIIVNLSHLDHLLVHYYLCFCSILKLNEKLLYAFNLMIGQNINLLQYDEKDVLRSLTYLSKLKEEYSCLLSEKKKGIPLSEEQKVKLHFALLGKNTGPKSEQHRKAIKEAAQKRNSHSTKGRISIYNNILKKKKYVKPEELDQYLNDGWIKGGTPHTEQEKLLIGANSKKCLTGTTRSEETKRKTSETMKKIANDKNSNYYKTRKRKKVDEND